MQWLEMRHEVRHAPELVGDPRAFRQSLHNIRGLILPPSIALDSNALHFAPVLRAVGRVSAGAENIDMQACGRAGIEVVRSVTATAQAEAEFMLGALLSMLRRVPIVGADGTLVGRELGAAMVGLIGMVPTARTMAQLLGAFGSNVVGYDPTRHVSDSLWERWRVKSRGSRELLEESDAVCVQLNYFSRYRRLLGERFLTYCKANQVMVSISHSGLFDENSLADVLERGQMAAAWFDSREPGAFGEGRTLYGVGSLQITPRVASTTRESRLHSAWARRIDELLNLTAETPREFKSMTPDVALDPSSEPVSP